MGRSAPDASRVWPALPLEAWVDSKRTLHRYCQVLGKIRLALAPFRNHWWHVTLAVGTRGLTTGPMPTGDGRTVEVGLDLVDHAAAVSTSDGGTASVRLRDGLACGDFYSELFAMLDRAGVDVRINPRPFDLDGPLLSRDGDHRSYDADAVHRYWTILRLTAQVLDEFAGRFNGKQSPVQLFWHTFDLALARYSGRPAPPRSGVDRVTAEAYSHEVIAFGFWPGDDRVPYPAFYSYTAPAPPTLTEHPLRPGAAWWDAGSGTATLPYEDVRSDPAPRSTLLAFLTSAYEAGAGAAGWDVPAFATRADPPRRGRPAST